MSAAQVCGDPFCPCGCGAWFGQCAKAGFTFFHVTSEPQNTAENDMPNDDETRNAETLPPPTDRTPTELETQPENEKPADDHAARLASAPGEDYFAQCTRDFAAALVEMRGTREDIATGFRSNGAELAGIRIEMRNFGSRITNIESEVADLKETIRKLGGRLEALEAELERRKANAHVSKPSTA